MMAESYITFNDVSFSYNSESTQLIKNLSFSVKERDRVVLQGESGTGKTTIYRLLLGFEQPDKGNILFKDQHLNAKTVQEIRQQTAWLPQDLDLGSGKVKSLINLPFRFKKNDAAKPAKEQITDTFEHLGLPASSLKKDFADLSTGQRRRVGIAICYLLDKPLILLDEPTSALDTASKEKVANLILGNTQKTILSTSHDPWWIERCETVFELNS